MLTAAERADIDPLFAHLPVRSGAAIDALRIVQRGDLRPEGMNGNWAGEFGALQITASDSYANAVDYDGDGRRDLIHSTPDTLASAASFLRSLGWQRGQPWLQEVRVPAEMPWQEADLDIQHPVSKWVAWGVKPAHGRLPDGKMQASLLLPMGRLGPAFLAYPNFDVYTQWNQSLVYATTAAYFATRLAGAPPLRRGSADAPTREQVQHAQKRLARLGYSVGKADGVIGAQTRAAVKAVQQKLGLPADSYPDPTFLAALEKM